MYIHITCKEEKDFIFNSLMFRYILYIYPEKIKNFYFKDEYRDQRSLRFEIFTRT